MREQTIDMYKVQKVEGFEAAMSIYNTPKEYNRGRG